MRRHVVILVAIGLAALPGTLAAQAARGGAAAEQVPIVAVTGCLAQQGSDWLLTRASEPAESSANGEAKKEAAAPLGKRQFKLIGVGEYNLAAMKGKAVSVKALHVKGTPMDRLNLTSVQALDTACGAAGQ